MKRRLLRFAKYAALGGFVFAATSGCQEGMLQALLDFGNIEMGQFANCNDLESELKQRAAAKAEEEAKAADDRLSAEFDAASAEQPAESKPTASKTLGSTMPAPRISIHPEPEHTPQPFLSQKMHEMSTSAEGSVNGK